MPYMDQRELHQVGLSPFSALGLSVPTPRKRQTSPLESAKQSKLWEGATSHQRLPTWRRTYRVRRNPNGGSIANSTLAAAPAHLAMQAHTYP